MEEFIAGELLAHSIFVKDNKVAHDFIGKDETYLNKYMISTTYPIKIKDASLELMRKKCRKNNQSFELKRWSFSSPSYFEKQYSIYY